MCERGSAKAPLAASRFWKRDDALHGVEPRRGLQHLPADEVAEADFEDVEIEGRIEVVAERTFAGKTVDPGGDAAFVVDVVVERHRHLGLVGAAADLIAGVEIQ